MSQRTIAFFCLFRMASLALLAPLAMLAWALPAQAKVAIQPLRLDVAALHAVMQPNGPRAQQPFTGIILVAQQGNLLWNFNPKAAPITAQRQFVIGSQSKQITATLVLQAVDQQRLSLTDPLSKYLPEQRERYGDAIQINHLLTHSSGIATSTSTNTSSVTTAPGQVFAYSNQGYDLLGQVLERIYAEPFAVQTTRLFRRCQMTHSFAPTAQQLTSMAPLLVVGLMERNGQQIPAPLDVPFSNNPSGRLVSSAGDLIAWQQCLHQQGLLQAATYQQMTSPQMLRPHRWGALGYGYGLQISRSENLTEFSHSGYVDGFISTTLYYPQFATGVVVLEPLSLDSAQMNRTFYYHDQVRTEVRRQLRSLPFAETGAMSQ